MYIQAVIPAKAGTQSMLFWTPASAGVTTQKE